MSGATGGGLVLALGSTSALNWSFFRQHGAASTLPPLSPRAPLRSLRILFRERSWLAGFAVGLGGWALYVAALRLAPLSLVQAVSAGGIGLLALLVARGGRRLSGRERAGVAAAVGGLVLLGVSLAGGAPAGSEALLRPAIWIVVSLAAAALAVGPGGRLLAGGAGFGVAAGVLYAAGDVATKVAVGGGASIAFAGLVLACHGLAFAALQLGFQRGGALATAGVSSLLTNALPIAAGMAVFGESLPGDGLGVARSLAFCAVGVGAALLAVPAQPAQPARASSAASTSASVL